MLWLRGPNILRIGSVLHLTQTVLLSSLCTVWIFFNVAHQVLFFCAFDVHLRKLANCGTQGISSKLYFIFPCRIMQEQLAIIVGTLITISSLQVVFATFQRN